MKGSSQDKVDGNYLFSCMQPQYSEAGKSRKALEEQVVDNFQDFLNNIEHSNVSGYAAPVAWNYQDDEEKKEAPDGLADEQFGTPEVCVPGVMSWLTGHSHKPLNGKKLVITILFDHDCKSKDRRCTIYFPLVGACGMQVTFPV